MFLLLMSLALANEPLTHGSSRLRVSVAEGWIGQVKGDDDRAWFTVSRPEDQPPYITVSELGSLQPSLARIDPFELVKLQADEGATVTPDPADPTLATVEGMGPVRVTREEHETLGPLVRAELLEPVTLVGNAFTRRLVWFELGGRLGAIETVDLTANGGADKAMETALASVRATSPRVTWERFRTGTITLDDVYTLELPESWRRATAAEERDWFDSTDAEQVDHLFYDASTLAPQVTILCTRVPFREASPAFHDPLKRPTEETDFRRRMSALLTGNSFDSDQASIHVPTGDVDVPDSAAGEVERVLLGDRPAYRWSLPFTVRDQPRTAHMVATQVDGHHLECLSFDAEGQEEVVQSILGSLRVAEPWVPGLYDQYVEAWPTRSPVPHPLWFLGPAALLATFGLGWTVSRMS